MSSFTPPLVQVVPTFTPDSTQDQIDLWRHYENRIRGVNVWILSDNTVVQSDPSPENSNTDMSAVFPWNISNPQDPYVRSIYIDPGVRPQVPSEHDVAHNPYPVAYFQGGTTTPVTAAQATLLTNYTAFGTGYGDCIA